MSQRDLPDGFPVVTASFIGSKGGQRVLIGYLGERLNGDQSGASRFRSWEAGIKVRSLHFSVSRMRQK
jgi:hypothetical protein